MNDIKGTNGIGFMASSARALRTMLPHGVALLCAVASAGCLAQGVEGEDESLGEAQEAALTNNALTNNALTNNALTNNALTNNALTNNALTNNALTAASLQTALTDPNAREVLKYIVSCALPVGKQVNFTVDSVSYAFDGELGLAPQWGNAGGKCDTNCQEWVSACVMSRVDYLGVKVPISMRGKIDVLDATPSETSMYTANEGTYYGNIFLATAQRHACIAPGRSGLPRVCGPSTVGCVVDIIGSCDQVCDKADKKYGFYPNCRDKVKDAHGNFPSGTTTYAETATIFLAP